MASLIRPRYVRPIPPEAERITHKGKPAVRFKGQDGRPVIGYPTGRGDTCRVQSRNWYGQFKDAAGARKRVPLETANKEAARRILARLVDREDDRRAGRADPYEAHARTPLGRITRPTGNAPWPPPGPRPSTSGRWPPASASWSPGAGSSSRPTSPSPRPRTG